MRAESDFYRVLGVSPLADERTIKSRFRRLAAQHHPDKLNQQQATTLSDGFFMYLKQAQDTLLDPSVRFAYDRFGPQVNEWRNVKTAGDYLYAGLRKALTQYIGGLVVLVVYWVYWSSWGRYVGDPNLSVGINADLFGSGDSIHLLLWLLLSLS